MRRGALILAINATWLAAACGAPPAEHVALGGSLDSLSTTFTADSSKVRAIFLASPT